VDGCLTEERSRPFDLTLITKIKEFNDQAQENPGVYPPITLCTGRPQPYVEALLKTIGAPFPAITENGGIIFDLFRNAYHYDENFTSDWMLKLFELKKFLISNVLPKTSIRIQPGKETHLTLITDNPKRTRQLLAEQLNSHLDDFLIDETESHLNLVPRIFDKGTGFKKLVGLTQIPAEEIAAIGDAEADLAFLKLAGFPMCPGNASAAVKARCRYVAQQTYTAGLIEIIEKCVAYNRGDWKF
jgi:HAD superfamily hydrolase (TIGR01484 family)